MLGKKRKLSECDVLCSALVQMKIITRSEIEDIKDKFAESEFNRFCEFIVEETKNRNSPITPEMIEFIFIKSGVRGMNRSDAIERMMDLSSKSSDRVKGQYVELSQLLVGVFT